MDIDVTDQVHDEIRREIAIRQLTVLLSGYPTDDLEELVDLLIQQQETVQAWYHTAAPSQLCAAPTEEPLGRLGTSPAT